MSGLRVHLSTLVAAFADRRILKMSHYDWVFWLNLTNIALGIVVVLALLLVAYGVVWEVMIRRKKQAGLRDMDAEMQSMLNKEFSHTLTVPELGVTMADGGEHVKPASPKQPKEKKQK
jgi:hypothetical protein